MDQGASDQTSPDRPADDQQSPPIAGVQTATTIATVPQRANSIPPTRIKPVVVAVAPPNPNGQIVRRRSSVMGANPNSPQKVVPGGSDQDGPNTSAIRRRSTGRAHRLSILLNATSVLKSSINSNRNSINGGRGSLGGRAGSTGGEDPAVAAAAAAMAAANAEPTTQAVPTEARRLSDSAVSGQPRKSLTDMVRGVMKSFSKPASTGSIGGKPDDVTSETGANAQEAGAENMVTNAENFVADANPVTNATKNNETNNNNTDA
eukprot:CAMPEP_0182424392 /NCGR_PEP_ID=MMETSP1167-20130531/10614_1 /TAXON_ID=2988 /ORGANISM="Mallomonas Sp, Strain CCMP3275" /LENGTH=261 /DNA_ID=CAMNT_0024604193 /DNA_START=218 /DNA_END=1003 /DNA_ORIENTATION=-